MVYLLHSWTIILHTITYLNYYANPPVRWHPGYEKNQILYYVLAQAGFGLDGACHDYPLINVYFVSLCIFATSWNTILSIIASVRWDLCLFSKIPIIFAGLISIANNRHLCTIDKNNSKTQNHELSINSLTFNETQTRKPQSQEAQGI